MGSEKESEKFAWTPFLRQLLVGSGAWMLFFIFGMCTGAPTVFIPQIRRESNSSDAVSEDMASWLPATIVYSGLPWIFILPIVVTFYGRKLPHALVCSVSFLGFLIFYCSTNVYHILISEIFQGVVTGSYLTISIIVITEYTSTKYRGVFLTLKSATFFWGILASNTIGTFLHWRQIALVGLLCSVYNLITVFFWPESPVWLATRKRFDECAKSHRWLKGSDKESEKELQGLISRYENIDIKPVSLKHRISDIVKTLCTKNFYKPVIFSILLLLLYVCSGKLVCTVYAIDIIKKMTDSEATAYSGMLILDGVTVLGMYAGCFISKVLKRRTLLLVSSSIGVVFLFVMSLYLYLVKLEVITEDKFVSISLLVCYSIAIGCGPMILSTSITGELIPLDSRSLSMCMIAITFKLISGTFMKLAPYIFKWLGLHGAFLFFGLSSSFFLLLIYLYLPETKDKSAQDIADFLQGSKPLDEARELLPTSKNIVHVTCKQ